MKTEDTPANVGSMEGLGLRPERAEWGHLKRYGYAPGNYMSKCHRCQKVEIGLDKRAITCRSCAEALATAAPQDDGTADDEGGRIDKLLLLAKNVVAASDRTQCDAQGYIVPAAEWLALQAEVMHRLREHAREGFLAVLRPNNSLNGAHDGA